MQKLREILLYIAIHILCYTVYLNFSSALSKYRLLDKLKSKNTVTWKLHVVCRHSVTCHITYPMIASKVFLYKFQNMPNNREL